MLLGLAGGFLKSLGGKKKKKKTSGEEMANNITNKPNEKGSSLVVTKEKKSIVKGADITPLKDIRDDMKQSSGENKDPLNLALNGIDNSLFGIIDTLTETNAIRKKIKKSDEEDELVEKKRLRERMIEGAVGFIKGATNIINEVTDGGLDKLMNFLTQTLVGALVNTIIKNWEEIKKQTTKVVEQIKEVYKNLEPLLMLVKRIGVWVISKGLEFIKEIDMSKVKKTDEDVKELEGILKELEDTEEKINQAVKKRVGGELGVDDVDNMVDKDAYKPTNSNIKKENKQKKTLFNYIDVKTEKYKFFIKKLERPNLSPSERKIAERWYNDNKGALEKHTGYIIVDSQTPKSVLGPNDVVYDSTSETFSKDLKQSPKIIKKFPQPLTLSNTVSSYAVGLESYSDDFDESSIILFSEGEGGSMNNGSKTPMFFGGSSGGLNIEDLYKIKINQ